MIKFVYKVCDRSAWEAAQPEGFFPGSADDARDGYIHLSTRAQIRGTLDKHFVRIADLLLIEFPAEALSSHLKWEASANGNIYPHYYGPLPVAAAVRIHRLALDADVCHVLPGDLE